MNYSNKFAALVLFTLFFLHTPLVFSAQEANASESHQGFIAEHRDSYFSCIRTVDALLEKYKSYYSVDAEERKIVLKQELTPHDKKMIIGAYKGLQENLELFGSCSPGDYDYIEVKNVYYPLLREVGHAFHTYVMQPLGIRTLDAYDHTRKILVPVFAVSCGVIIILLLQKVGLFPQCSARTLVICALLIASAGVVYNYWSEIASWKKDKGIDFATLARSQQESREESLLERVASDVKGVLKDTSSSVKAYNT